MKLQTKAVLGVNLFIVIACLCMGILGYRSAADGFAKSLQMKADSNVKSLLALMDDRYPGEWRIENNALYKGNQQIEGSTDIVDSFGNMLDGHVTFFREIRVWQLPSRRKASVLWERRPRTWYRRLC